MTDRKTYTDGFRSGYAYGYRDAVWETYKDNIDAARTRGEWMSASGPWELPVGLRWSEDPDLPVHQVHQVPEVHLCRQPEACRDAHNGIRA